MCSYGLGGNIFPTLPAGNLNHVDLEVFVYNAVMAVRGYFPANWFFDGN
jgi:hypothetical protein